MTASPVWEYITFSQMNINQNVFILLILLKCERQQNKNEQNFLIVQFPNCPTGGVDSWKTFKHFNEEEGERWAKS